MNMVVVDVFIVWRATERSESQSIENLRFKMDEHAPQPFELVGPSGELLFIFCVDFHKAPRVVCEQMGFQYTHACYAEFPCDSYMSINQMQLQPYRWIKVFYHLWSQSPQYPPTAHSS